MASWRPIPGSPEYWVSDDGRVWSRRSRQMLKQGWHRYGYPQVQLPKSFGGFGSRSVHSLVMAAFVGPLPAGLEVRHLDGDPTNCHLSNLRYGTRSENTKDAVRHGTHFTPWRDPGFQAAMGAASAKARRARTRCKRGHLFDEANTRIDSRGARRCRACERDRMRARRAAQ